VPAVSPAKLAESAGLALGFYRNELTFETHIRAALLLVRAGADLTLIRDWMREGARGWPSSHSQHAGRQSNITVRRTCNERRRIGIPGPHERLAAFWPRSATNDARGWEPRKVIRPGHARRRECRSQLRSSLNPRVRDWSTWRHKHKSPGQSLAMAAEDG
jgi:hypothetical protein